MNDAQLLATILVLTAIGFAIYCAIKYWRITLAIVLAFMGPPGWVLLGIWWWHS
jgi:hypothetical protein